MPNHPTIPEFSQELIRRDCLPLTDEEATEFVELFRRATAGCGLLPPPAGMPSAMLPGAWLTEFAAAVLPHVRKMEADAALLQGRRGGEQLCYDPLNEVLCRRWAKMTPAERVAQPELAPPRYGTKKQ